MPIRCECDVIACDGTDCLHDARAKIRADVKAMPGLKEDEVRAIAQCASCDQPVGRSGPIFFRVTVEQIILDVVQCQRQHGLAVYLQSASLAAIMGTNEDLAKISDTSRVGICMSCAAELRRLDVYAILAKKSG